MNAAAAYVRVSTRGQDYRSQRAAIKRAARARGHNVRRWFEEKTGGDAVKRPALAALRAAARRGELDTLYVDALDRLMRRGVADTLNVVTELRDAGVNVIFVSQDLPETRGPWGDVVFAVLAAAASIELSRIRERISAARATAERWGRPRREVDVERARAMREKKSLREVARALKVPRTTLARRLAKS